MSFIRLSDPSRLFEELLSNPLEPQELHNESLLHVPVVLASKTRYGHPQWLWPWEEPLEEGINGGMQLGQDLQVAFTDLEHQEEVKQLIETEGLKDQLQVESIEILIAASRIDRALGLYFYDIYNLRKWQAAF